VVSYLSAFSGASAWPWNAIVCVAVLGAYSAASDGVLASLASGLLPIRARALGLAWVATAVSVARLCSAVAFGFLWTRAGDRIAVLFFTAALVAVICVALPGRELDPSVTG
jgi:MFS family permease